MIKKFKKLFESSTELPTITTDIHSHLIPGIDDGVKEMDEAIDMIKRYMALGYTKLITTPHIMSHRYPNTSAILRQGLFALKQEVRSRGLNIEIEVASEYYLDETVMHLVEKGDILTFGKNYMLFEMSYVQPLHYLEDMLFEIKVAGYTPVLAHPERYMYMHDDFTKYERLKALGVLFQVNIPSLGGYYSKPVQKAAEKIAKAGFIDFIGSDAHNMGHLDTIALVREKKSYTKLLAKNTILNQTL